MNKTLKITLIAIDKTNDLVYNIAITNNNTIQGTKIMTLARFMNYIQYTDKRPENISAARWCAMRASFERKINA